jgi:hypothetical protein
MSEDALYRNDPARMLLSRSVNHSHAAAADLFQDFVMTEPPLGVGHVRFYKDTFESFTRLLAFGFKSLA